jgi:hypothetical protein
MSDVPVSKLQDDDMQAAPTALIRAGVQARELARKTGTAVVIVRDGILVEERADDSALPALAPTANSRK